MRFLILTLLFIFSCAKKEDVTNDIISDFNKRASDSFEKNFNTYDLGSMSDLDRCILRKGITNYLDELNNWKLTVIDSFYIRGYDFGDLGIRFNFVANKRGEYYFMYLPHLTDYLIQDLVSNEYYNYGENGQIILKDSINLAISQVDSEMLDNFLWNEVFNSKDYRKQYLETERLLMEFFPFLEQEILLPNLLEELEHEPKANRDYIMQVINPIINREATLTGGSSDFRIYNFDPFGWILIDYFVDHTNSDFLGMNMYFIAHKYSFRVGYETETNKYKECLKQYDYKNP